MRVADRHHDFDPAVEIAAHGVARGDVDPGVVVGQRAAAGEGPDAAVFEKPPDDRLDRDVVRKPGNAGSQAADAAHHQADLDPGRAGVVEPVDQLRIGQRIELGPDRRGLALARAGDLAIDAFVQPGAHRQRRDRQHLGRGRFDIAGDEIEQPAGVAAGFGIGGEEAEVGIDPRGDRVIVAGAEVAVCAVGLALAAHDHRNLGVGLPVDEAVDHLHAGALELGSPEQVLLLVEPRLELDHGGDRLARLGRGDQRRDHRRLLAGAVQRLLDRDDIGIGCRLAQEIDHHLEAFVGVVDDDVFLADGGEAIAIVLANAFGIARAVGLELEVRAVLLDDRGEPGEADQAVGLGHHRLIEPELVAQQFLGGEIESALQLQQDHRTATTALDGGAEIADEILRILLDLEVAVAQHAEHPVAADLEPGKQQVRVTEDDLLDADVDRGFAGQPDEPRQGRRDQYHFHHRRRIRLARQRQENAHALVGDEGERMRRIDRLGREDGQHMLEEMLLQPFALASGDLPAVDDGDSSDGQLGPDVAPGFLLRLLEFNQRVADGRKLLRGAQSVDRSLLHLAPHLPGETGNPHHQEFVEIAARNRQEPQLLQQRIVRIGSFGQDPAIEGEPAQLAIEVAPFRNRTGGQRNFAVVLSCAHRSPARQFKSSGTNGICRLQMCDTA